MSTYILYTDTLPISSYVHSFLKPDVHRMSVQCILKSRDKGEWGKNLTIYLYKPSWYESLSLVIVYFYRERHRQMIWGSLFLVCNTRSHVESSRTSNRPSGQMQDIWRQYVVSCQVMRSRGETCLELLQKFTREIRTWVKSYVFLRVSGLDVTTNFGLNPLTLQNEEVSD